MLPRPFIYFFARRPFLSARSKSNASLPVACPGRSSDRPTPRTPPPSKGVDKDAFGQKGSLKGKVRSLETDEGGVQVRQRCSLDRLCPRGPLIDHELTFAFQTAGMSKSMHKLRESWLSVGEL